jgi:hypothetical protein
MMKAKDHDNPLRFTDDEWTERARPISGSDEGTSRRPDALQVDVGDDR